MSDALQVVTPRYMYRLAAAGEDADPAEGERVQRLQELTDRPALCC